MENWFVKSGAINFISDYELRPIGSMSNDVWEGFNYIIKAFFYSNNFLFASGLIQKGKPKYQDLENSILSMNTSG